jgi:hypothetical protein
VCEAISLRNDTVSKDALESYTHDPSVDMSSYIPFPNALINLN